MSYFVISFTVLITVLGYMLGRYIFHKTKNPILNPVFLTTMFVITTLKLTGLQFGDYETGKNIMTFLLGPATVALALPLYRNRNYLRASVVPIGIGITAGSLVNVIAVTFLGQLAGLDKTILLSLAPKSVTAPIAVEIAGIIGGDPALTAIFVVFTGLLGAALGSMVLTAFGVTDPVARGISIGATSHGQGTAAALEEGETQGAMSGVAMALGAVLTSVVVPFLLPIII